MFLLVTVEIKSDLDRQVWSAVVLSSAYVETSSSYQEDEISALMEQTPEALWGSGIIPATLIDASAVVLHPGSLDCTGCSLGCQLSSGLLHRHVRGLPCEVSRTRELIGVLPPASFHRLTQPCEGIILCLTCYLEVTLSSGQAKDKMPAESSHSIKKKRKCCCKGCVEEDS